MAFDFLAQIEALTPRNLTVREQTRLAENPLDLRWPGIFPRGETDSILIRELSAADFRPLGGRREWNAQGREIIEVLGPRVDAEIVPINPTHHIDERRMQALRERAFGAQTADLFSAGIVKDVDAWATELADAVARQIEFDAFRAWYQNTITVMDPKTGTTTTVTPIVSTSRYVASSATYAAAADAYVLFLTQLRAARSAMGSVGAVRMRQARLDEILADAPAVNGDVLTLGGLQSRLNAEGFGVVNIVVDERTYHGWDDGGSAYTEANYVPADRVAFQPANGIVGTTYFAPVTRAEDFGIGGRRVGGNSDLVSLQDTVVMHSPKNDGKTLMVEAQANALSLPVEQWTYVVTGVA